MANIARIVNSLVYRNTKLQVVHGNIVIEPSEAIVNAANGQLKHGAGVAGAIAKAAGPLLVAESEKWVLVKGTVPVGGVAVTGPGNLMCKAVIHAVGPIYQGKESDHTDLSNAVSNSLTKCIEMGLRSISLPAISSGIFGFPKDKCAQILIGTTMKVIDSSSNGLDVVRFTNFDEPTVSYFDKELEKLKT